MATLELAKRFLNGLDDGAIKKIEIEQLKEIASALENENLDDAYETLCFTSKNLDAVQFLQLYQLIATKDALTPTKYDLQPILNNLNDRHQGVHGANDYSADFPRRQINALVKSFEHTDMETLKEMFFTALVDGDEATALKLIKRGVPLDFVDPASHMTPISVAHALRLQKCIVEMYKRGAIPTPDQFTIMNKMSRVILDIPGVSPHTTDDLKGISFEPLDDPYPENEVKHISRDLAAGLCYGFSAYWLYLQKYFEPGTFEKNINQIIDWNGEESSLSQPLKDKLRDIFDNVFFLASEGSEKMIRGRGASPETNKHAYVHKRLNIIKPIENPKIKKEYQFSFVMSENEIEEVLSKTVHPDKLIRLRIGANHWVALLQKGSEYHYYDPNANEYQPPLGSMAEVKQAIIDTYTRYYNVKDSNPDSHYGIGLYIYDDIRGEKINYPTQESLMKSLVSKRNSGEIDLKGCSMYKEGLRLFGDEESIGAFDQLKAASARRRL